ncbi:FAS1 domain [Cinara cedri]|uniref:FAS1 domain n=1 Tax=Cinara cedri TaxID=506608 RepID=A0A5E4NFJ6_9HEMI|nr:FAS1 domain [Cinara cedri]
MKSIIASGIFSVLFCGSAFAALSLNGNDKTVIDTLAWTSDFSEIYSIIERNEVANNTIHIRSVTVFAPNNDAFQKYNKLPNDDAILPCYHMTTVAVKLEELGSSVLTDLDANPPIWITKKSPEDIYVNQAKVIIGLSNYGHNLPNGKLQVLHVIDQVLEPLRLKDPTSTFPSYPDAWQFMENIEKLEVNNLHTSSFFQRVLSTNKKSVFSNQGGHTFFIPVDDIDSENTKIRFDKIDEKVVDAHVIPDNVLFMGPTDEHTQFKTLAFTDMLRVFASIASDAKDKNENISYFVSSDTIVRDGVHNTGAVVAKILKANIPVKNGVVHLINKPLMIVENNVKQFIEKDETSQLHKFYEAIKDSDSNFMDQLKTKENFTLFAPSNAAFEDPSIQSYLGNHTYIKSLLYLHIVNKRLTINDIDSESVDKRFQVPTEVPRKDLFFNVITSGNNRTLTLEGGGVNATVVMANLAATNGIIHIIDHILGIPSSTIDRKLATDPSLNETNYLGQVSGLNEQLSDVQKRFTYFVPRDTAWKRLLNDNPLVYKKLFEPEYAAARQVLERHLIIAEKAYTMEDFKNEAKNNYNLSVKIPTVRDASMYIKIRDDPVEGFLIEWRNEWIRVHRADIRCTNGLIHVIDKVLVDENDVDVNAGIVTTSVTVLLLVFAQSFVFYYFN